MEFETGEKDLPKFDSHLSDPNENTYITSNIKFDTANINHATFFPLEQALKKSCISEIRGNRMLQGQQG